MTLSTARWAMPVRSGKRRRPRRWRCRGVGSRAGGWRLRRRLVGRAHPAGEDQPGDEPSEMNDTRMMARLNMIVRGSSTDFDRARWRRRHFRQA